MNKKLTSVSRFALSSISLCVAFLLLRYIFSSNKPAAYQKLPTIPDDVRARLSSRLEFLRPLSATYSTSHLSSSIKISGNLPLSSTAHVPIPDFVREWQNTIRSLEAAAFESLETTFDESELERLRGVPGTSIDTKEEADQLQKFLDCASSKGQWVWDETGSRLSPNLAGLTNHKQSSNLATCDRKYYKGREAEDSTSTWDVRDSLKYRWEADASCLKDLPSHVDFNPKQTLPSRQDFCRLLEKKYILLTGDITQFLIHDLFLDWTIDAPATCFGDLYCYEHAICPKEATSKGTMNGWEHDDIAFKRLPIPPAHVHSHHWDKALKHEPSKDTSTMLRYRRNDGFIVHHPDDLLEPVFLHPKTGIRQLDNFVTPDFRRSDLIIFSRAPFPLPVTDSANGEAVRELRQGDWTSQGEAIKLLTLVQEMTLDTWLPEMMRSLYHSRTVFFWNYHGLTVWRGGWRIQPECAGSVRMNTSTWNSPGDGLPPLPSAPSLQEILYKDPSRPEAGLVDIESLFFNLQTMVHNHLLRKIILPPLGVPFLDMETPMSIWRTGMLGSAAFDSAKTSNEASAPGSRNCLLPCLPSAGMSAEEAFIGGLHRIMQWGWDKDPQQWIGDTSTPLRTRKDFDNTRSKKNRDKKVGKARSGAGRQS